MKRLLCAGLLALPLLALPSRAMAFNIGGYQVDTGVNVWFNVRGSGLNGPGGGAGPWYLYWPYAGYANVPPPPISPCYTPMMTLPPGFGQPPPMPYAQAYGAPAQGYTPPPPTPGQRYTPPPPTPGPGYQPPPVPQPPTMYRPPVPAGPGQPGVYSYYAR